MLGSSRKRSEGAAAARGVQQGYADFDALLADRPDVVHVCTPNDTHVPYALAIVAAGIHLVLEQQVASDVASAQVVVADRSVYDGYNAHPGHVEFVSTRWDPEVEAFQEYDFTDL